MRHLHFRIVIRGDFSQPWIEYAIGRLPLSTVQLRTECGFDSWKLKFQKRPIINNSSGLAQGCFSLNIQNRKNDASLFSLRNIKILTNMQKNFFEILVLTALTVGLIWTILELTPKSALLSLTILYFSQIKSKFFFASWA